VTTELGDLRGEHVVIIRCDQGSLLPAISDT
jgi:hypothetical protein